MTIAERVAKLEIQLEDLSAQLMAALTYASSDPSASLTKSRIVLEKLLIDVFRSEMGNDPKRPLINEMLSDNQFTRRLERRILARMRSLQDVGNLGAHGERVEPADANRAIEDLCEVVEWYIARCGSARGTAPEGEPNQAQSLQLAKLLEFHEREPKKFFHDFSQAAQRDVVTRQGYAAGNLVGHDVIRHLSRLANSAFISGDSRIVALLSKWTTDPPREGEPQLVAWAIEALLHSGFFGTLERCLSDSVENPTGRKALQRLIDGNILGADSCYASLPLTDEDRAPCQKILSDQVPWMDDVSSRAVLTAALSRFVVSLRRKSGGGWD